MVPTGDNEFTAIVGEFYCINTAIVAYQIMVEEPWGTTEIIWHVALVHKGTSINFWQALVLRKTPNMVPFFAIRGTIVHRHFKKLNYRQNKSDYCLYARSAISLSHFTVMRDGTTRFSLLSSHHWIEVTKLLLPRRFKQKAQRKTSELVRCKLHVPFQIISMEALQKELAKIQVTAPDINSLP